MAVQLLDKALETALLYRGQSKRCAVCGRPFLSGSNRAKYCKSCAVKAHRGQKVANERKRRLLRRQLEAKKS